MAVRVKVVRLRLARGSLAALVMSCTCLGYIPTEAVAAYAPDDTSSNEWPEYGRDHSQQRFSPADSINAESVKHLGLQWSLDLPNETALVSTPLFIDGTLYFTGNFSVVYAVDAKQGRLKWTF